MRALLRDVRVRRRYRRRVSGRSFSSRLLHLAASATLLLVVFASLASTGHTPPKRVLVFESFGQPSTTAASDSFRTTLERGLGQPVDIYNVFLDAARFPRREDEAELVDFLKSRYRERKPDLVATMLAPAAEFMMRHRAELFAETPLVIAGLDRRRIPADVPRDNTTYVAGAGDLPGRVENILRLLPETRRVVILYGASAFDKFWLQESRRELQQFAGRVEMVWMDGLSLVDMLDQAASLSTGSVLFLHQIILDATGMPIGRDEVLARLRAVSQVPIFGYFESYEGKGIVGGSLYPDVTIGVAAAHVAIRILKGESPGSVEPVLVKQTHPIYDWRELRRFGISEARLPPGSEVRHRQLTVWEAYGWYIAATFALVVLQAAFIIGLVVQRSRQRRAEAERKRAEAELHNTRVELAHIGRVSTLSELSGSLAHELNQPLTAIMTNVQAAQRFMETGTQEHLQEVREILADVVRADQRASEVLHRIRSLVRKQEPAAAPLDLVDTAREVVLLLRSDAILRDVNLSFESDPGLPLANGDRVQLQQVILNLLLNAFDAVKESPERLVTVRVRQDGERTLKIAVCDTGHGFSGTSIDRVFEAFYTTKAGGLGMGLSISRSIVEAHGGKLWAMNNADRGATFFFTVPVEAR